MLQGVPALNPLECVLKQDDFASPQICVARDVVLVARCSRLASADLRRVGPSEAAGQV